MLPNTEDGTSPFWCTDSHYLAFIAECELKKISISGGDAQTLAEAASLKVAITRIMGQRQQNRSASLAL